MTNVAEGDKVIVHPLITCGLCRACRSGDDVHCEANAFPGIDTNGGYAEYLKTSARSVVKIDDSLEPSDVAALADAGLTAYHAAAKAARRLTPRDRCVIIGAGGLGHIGIQVLKALTPAELIVVDRNPERSSSPRRSAPTTAWSPTARRWIRCSTDGRERRRGRRRLRRRGRRDR